MENVNKTVLLVDCGDTGNESEAIRQNLERLGYFVLHYPIGRPNDFVKILKDEIQFFKFNFLIFSCHGEENGKIIMPVLGKDIYEKNEPKHNFGFNEIRKYLKLTNKTIISLGCYTGKYEEMTRAFTEKNNNYIAPDDAPMGCSALNFVCNLFYYLKDNELEIAHKKASSVDAETKLFKLYNHNYAFNA